jgi:hypothetical protein
MSAQSGPGTQAFLAVAPTTLQQVQQDEASVAAAASVSTIALPLPYGPEADPEL